MLLGRLRKLFQLRSKDFNKDKQPISSGSAPSLRLQAHKSSTSKQHIPDKAGNLRSVRLLAILLHPSKDNTLRFFKRKMDAGGCLIEVPLPSNSSKLSTFPKFSGIYLSLEQPDRSSFLRDFKQPMLLGML